MVACRRSWIVALLFGGCGQGALALSKGQPGYKEPPVWPEQFHSVMCDTLYVRSEATVACSDWTYCRCRFQNRSSKLALVELWYDWPAQRNLNLIHMQQAGTLWDIEYGNTTSFYFDREANTCRRIKFPVGILTQDWLADAEYLGQDAVDSHDCHVWKKGPRDFITYWADIETNRPVQWTFGWDGAIFHIMTWTEGAVLEDERWQAPEVCFRGSTLEQSNDLHHGSLLHQMSAGPTIV